MKPDFQPEAISVARGFRRLSVTDLAERSGLSRQFVSLLEAGKEKPYPLAISAISAALDFPVQYFFDFVERPLEENLHHRKTTRVRKSELTYIRDHATIALKVYAALSRYVDFADLKVERGSPEDVGSIERAAENQRRRLGLSLDSPIGNVIHTVEATGVLVAQYESEERVDGVAWKNSFRPIVLVNEKAVWSRKRLSVAHELGHLVLHHDPSESETREAEAFRFAGAFLMPQNAFRREFPRTERFGWAQIIALKERWGASIQAIIRRAFDLQLLDAAQYRTANIHINRNGWKTSEPSEQEPEMPAAPRMIVEQLDPVVGIERIADDADIPPSVFHSVLGTAPSTLTESSVVTRVLPFRS